MYKSAIAVHMTKNNHIEDCEGGKFVDTEFDWRTRVSIKEQSG